MDKTLSKVKVLIAEDDFLIAEEISRIIINLSKPNVGRFKTKRIKNISRS